MFQELKSKVAALVAVPLTTFSVSAYAALPDGVNTAISSVGTDLETAASLILSAMIGFWALRKLGTKMGWW